MAQISVKHEVLSPDLRQQTIRWLHDLTYYNGKTKGGQDIDRDQVWFHRQGLYFNPLWTHRYPRWIGHRFPEILEDICRELELELTEFNSCLVNRYNNGQCFIPKHIDSIDSFGPTPTIINLSLGATRTLRVHAHAHDHVHAHSYRDYKLDDNSLFIMSGPSTEHELLIEPECHTVRWSLTFRKHHPPSPSSELVVAT